MLTHLVSPVQDGLLIQDVFIIEGLENVRYFGQEMGVDLTHKLLKPNQQVFLGSLVVHHKLHVGSKKKNGECKGEWITTPLFYPLIQCLTSHAQTKMQCGQIQRFRSQITSRRDFMGFRT